MFFNSESNSSIIKKDGHEATLDDIYNIAYTSTDGNEEIANDIRKIQD